MGKCYKTIVMYIMLISTTLGATSISSAGIFDAMHADQVAEEKCPTKYYIKDYHLYHQYYWWVLNDVAYPRTCHHRNKWSLVIPITCLLVAIFTILYIYKRQKT